MSKKPISHFARVITILFAVLSFFFIDTLTTNPSTTRAVLFMAWGTLFLILFVVYFLNNQWPLGSQILCLAGCTLLAVFIVWTLSQSFKLFVQGVAHLLMLDWQIGNLFKGFYNYLASIPSLICGLILFVAAFIWDNPVNYERWTSPFLNFFKLFKRRFSSIH